MNSSLKCFITVAETGSFTQSAKKLFLTQQCVSGHIKKLEKAYGVPLFKRRPELSLTVAGQALLRTCKQIAVLEKGLEIELDEIADGDKGRLSFGIHAARSRIVMPNVLERFVPLFPKVEVDIFYRETSQLEGMLKDGELDLFFGISANRYDEFNYSHITNEPLFLVISDRLMRARLQGRYEPVLAKSLAGADLSDFAAVPFIFTHTISRTQTLVSQFLVTNNINLGKIITVSDHSLHVSLSAKNLGACVCPQMMLRQMRHWNESHRQHDQLHAFSIKGLDQTLRLELISHKEAYLPRYALAFKEIFAKEILEYCSDR